MNFDKWWNYKKTKNAVKNFTNIFSNNHKIEKKYMNFIKNTI